MGTLIYNDTLRLRIDDRTLEHLRFVVFEKLRKKESFALTWVDCKSSKQAASTSIWISSEIPIGFQLSGESEAELSREQLETLMKMSYSNRGLIIRSE
ncbi:DUF7882 family protein [Leucobacter sp. GX24907]